MENIYIFMLVALSVLAIADLVVGVSNDAVNFLNSGIGSKAVSFRTLMIVASLGIAVGALSSSGMMEVARKGIFNPSEFMFNEIMIVFTAVMVTDILLLDFFNSLGLPTSTTVSIVFELLGASVAVAAIKIFQNENESLLHITQYINNDKAIEIILGIFLSVIIAFSIGALIQYVARLILSFKFENKSPWLGAVFSGFANSSILYFIIVKGAKNASFMQNPITDFIYTNPDLFNVICFIGITLLSYLLIKFSKINIYKIIIVVGTFALALAFAGNDLVNFIGVPMAAYNAYLDWQSSGIAATNFSMESLAEQVQTQPILLLIAGLVMVLTLWFSSKAKNVVKTSVDLSRQNDVKERFEPNFISRNIVRMAQVTGRAFESLLGPGLKNRIEKQYEKPIINPVVVKKEEIPAFDYIRASVNLMVASVLISVATSMKLPLSTTYVTFMVAMGTSLADRAWGSESAVYRVAGVLNVVGGWFFTALSAFVAAAIVAVILFYGGFWALVIVLVLATFIITKSYLNYRKVQRQFIVEDRLKTAESSSTQGVIIESAKNISNVVKRGNKIYSNAINGLSTQNLSMLRKNKKQIDKLSEEIDELRDNIFYFIKKLEEPSIEASNFYINIQRYLQDMVQSLNYISSASYKHINNNHKKLKFSQIRDLKEIDTFLEQLFGDIRSAFDNESFYEIKAILLEKMDLIDDVTEKIQLQVERTRTEESSPKNTTLYFSILLETKDLITATMNLLEEYHKSYDKNIKPAVLKK